MYSLGAIFGIAASLGPCIAGIFTQESTWRWTFWANAPLGFPTIFIIFLLLPNYAREPFSWSLLWRTLPTVDYLGSFLIAAATTTAALAITWGGRSFAWGSPVLICLIIAAVISLGLFVVVELKVSKN